MHSQNSGHQCDIDWTALSSATACKEVSRGCLGKDLAQRILDCEKLTSRIAQTERSYGVQFRVVSTSMAAPDKRRIFERLKF